MKPQTAAQRYLRRNGRRDLARRVTWETGTGLIVAYDRAMPLDATAWTLIRRAEQEGWKHT